MAAAREHWSERLQRFDRRWIFLVMAVAVVVPLFFPLGLPAKPDPMTKAAFNAVEALPTSTVVDVVVDQLVTGDLERYVPKWFGDVAHDKAVDLTGYLAGSAEWYRDARARAAAGNG